MKGTFGANGTRRVRSKNIRPRKNPRGSSNQGEFSGLSAIRWLLCLEGETGLCRSASDHASACLRCSFAFWGVGGGGDQSPWHLQSTAKAAAEHADGSVTIPSQKGGWVGCWEGQGGELPPGRGIPSTSADTTSSLHRKTRECQWGPTPRHPTADQSIADITPQHVEPLPSWVLKFCITNEVLSPLPPPLGFSSPQIIHVYRLCLYFEG